MAKRRHLRRRTYGFSDFTDDSLEAAQMAVVRANYEQNCSAATEAMNRLREMAKYVVQQEPKREKSVAKLLKNSESYEAKACRNR